jgi:outer membrane immunogenic protein
MKKLLLGSMAAAALFSGGTAMAADMRPAPAQVYTKAPMMAPAFSWSGFYIGGNIGGAWSHGDVTDALFGLDFSNGNNNGVFIGGGQVGFNYQFSNFVIGAEADFDWAANNNNNGNGVVVPGVGTFQVTSNNTWISTAAARFGVAYDHWLFYGKAGGGWVGNKGFTVTDVTTGASFSSSNNNTTSGWLVGAGVEWAFAGNWSAKVEYDYLGLSGQTFSSSGVILAGDTFTTSRPNIQTVKFGINYRFGMLGM